MVKVNGSDRKPVESLACKYMYNTKHASSYPLERLSFERIEFYGQNGLSSLKKSSSFQQYYESTGLRISQYIAHLKIYILI